MKRPLVFSIVMVIMLVACQDIGTDVQGTLDAGDVVLTSESMAIQVAIQRDSTQIAETVAVGETRVMQIESINGQLFRTLSAGSTPTVPLIAGQADIRQEDMMMDDTGNLNRLFTQAGVSASVSSESGCVLNPQSSFIQSRIDQLYATAEVRNAGGTTIPMRVEWYYENEVVTEDNWQMTPNGSPYCFWFVIDRNDTDFAPGNWTVRMYADNFPLRDLTMSFVINE